MEKPNVEVKVDIEGPYWLTRDKESGVLSDTVEVWLTKPNLCRFEDGDVMWLPDLETVDTETTSYAEWTLSKCLKECYVIPDTERECIRVG